MVKEPEIRAHLWQGMVTEAQAGGSWLGCPHSPGGCEAFHKYASGDQDDEDETREVLTDDMPKPLWFEIWGG